MNGEVDAPRALVEGMIDPEFSGAKTRCCGAGGGRMWMEELPNQRPSSERMAQLTSTGATQIAVACPFCRIMLDSSNQDESIRLVDLAELLQASNPS
jgi:Fe-S oxidoreductase